jgi:subtilisin-like proprotein convertase family protein
MDTEGWSWRLAYLILAVALTIGIVLGTAAYAAAKAKTFSSGTLSAPLADDSLAVSKLNVRKQGKIKDIDVKVRADHTAPNDLVFTLRSPQGKYVKLQDFDNATGPDVGTGPNSCAGTPYIFNDEAPTPFPGAVPAVGSFQPQFPLGKLDRKRIKGRWELLIDDVNAGDAGTLGGWKLRIKYKPL